MKIQAVRNQSTSGNYQADRAKQQSFGIAKLDRRGVSLLSKADKAKLLAGYVRIYRELGELTSTQGVDVLVHAVHRKGAPAGVVIARPLKNGGVKEVFKPINDPAFDSTFTNYVRESLTTQEPEFGTFAEAAIKKPQPAHLWDTTIALPIKASKDRFAALA